MIMNRDINALKPAAAVVCRAFLRAADAAGLRVFVTCTVRTYADQAYLYASGRTRPGRILTYAPAGTSEHEKGEAFDVAFLGSVLYPPAGDARWLQLGLIAESLGLYWGGRFRSVDSPHFQTKKEGKYYEKKLG